MKRPSSFSMQDEPSPRRRHLSEEERALWESVARQVKPLRKKPRLPKIAASPAAEAPVASPAAETEQACRAAAGAARPPRKITAVAWTGRDRCEA
jgi:DNA-nicking Smr family endonuclease